MVEDIPPVTKLTAGVYRVLYWAFSEVVTGVVFFCGELRLQIPGEVCF